MALRPKRFCRSSPTASWFRANGSHTLLAGDGASEAKPSMQRGLECRYRSAGDGGAPRLKLAVSASCERELDFRFPSLLCSASKPSPLRGSIGASENVTSMLREIGQERMSWVPGGKNHRPNPTYELVGHLT